MQSNVLTVRYSQHVPDLIAGSEDLWTRQFNVARRFSTLLTDDELRACGLEVVKPDLHLQNYNIQILSSADMNQAALSGWLVRQPTNNNENVFTKPPAWFDQVAERVNELRRYGESEGLQFSEQSAEHVEHFTTRLTRAMRPSVFLIGNGNLRLLWVNDKNEQIGLQFLPDGKIQFVLFKLRGSELNHIMGIDTSVGVLETISSLGLTHLLHM